MPAHTNTFETSMSRLRDWIVDRALPIWAERAHLADGSWVEHLNLNGTPDLSAERRWRVLARQVYVYGKASQLNWFDGRDIAVRTYTKMTEVGHVHRVAMTGNVTNDMRDFYDHAFYILAAASLYSLTNETKYLADAESLLDWLDTNLAHPMGGWKESDQSCLSAPRRQNPHMHLLEASLFLHSITENPKHLRYAQDVFQLFQNQFFDKGTISEFFASDWTLAAGDHGQTAEPGHAVEWVWLLGQYAKATGTNVHHYQQALYSQALRSRDIFLNDEEAKSGHIRRETKRLWVQTEVIKAHLAMAENGTSGSLEMAAATIEALLAKYLTAEGFWKDQLNDCDTNVAQTIPVSTFYHILCMAAEAERISQL